MELKGIWSNFLHPLQLVSIIQPLLVIREISRRIGNAPNYKKHT